MKGIVFTEFLEMVEEQFGLHVVDVIIEEANLPSKGIYTSVGTYEFSELLSLISELQKQVNLPIGDLIHAFGRYLFNGLITTHPEVVEIYSNPISLLSAIEDHIHVHVKKLYPEAELPEFRILEKTDNSLSMVYSSSRGLYRLAQGLIEKSFEHFDMTGDIDYELLNDDGTETKFNIVCHGSHR